MDNKTINRGGEVVNVDVTTVIQVVHNKLLNIRTLADDEMHVNDAVATVDGCLEIRGVSVFTRGTVMMSVKIKALPETEGGVNSDLIGRMNVNCDGTCGGTIGEQVGDGERVGTAHGGIGVRTCRILSVGGEIVRTRPDVGGIFRRGGTD